MVSYQMVWNYTPSHVSELCQFLLNVSICTLRLSGVEVILLRQGGQTLLERLLKLLDKVPILICHTVDSLKWRVNT